MKGIAEPLEVLEGRDDGEFAEPLEGANAYRVARSGDVWLPVREIRDRLPAGRDAFIGRRGGAATGLPRSARPSPPGTAPSPIARRATPAARGWFPSSAWAAAARRA